MDAALNKLYSDLNTAEILKDDYITFDELLKIYRKKLDGQSLEVLRRTKKCFLQLLYEGDEDHGYKIFETVETEVRILFDRKLQYTVKEVIEDLNVSSTFLSNQFLMSYFRKPKQQFDVSELSHGLLITATGFTEEFYKKIMKERKNLMTGILNEHVEWDSLFKVYDIWKSECHEMSTCLQWIFTMAKFRLVKNFNRFEDNIKVQITFEIMDYLKFGRSKVRALTQSISKKHKQFISHNYVYDLLQQKYFIVEKDRHDFANSVVYIDPEKENQVVNYNEEGGSDMASNSSSLSPQICDIKLNEAQERRISPLLTIKVKYENIVSAYKNLRNKMGFTELTDEMVNRYGCFFRFLAEYCKFNKPKLSHVEYREALDNILKRELYEQVQPIGAVGIKDVMEKVENFGVLDREYVLRVAKNSPEVLGIFEDLITSYDYDTLQVKKDVMNDKKKIRESGILKVISLCTTFKKVKKTFIALDDDIKRNLKRKSMCFLEYLVELSKDHKKSESGAFITHLCMLVNEEIIAMFESKKELTLQNVSINLSKDCSSSMFVNRVFVRFCVDHCKKDCQLIINDEWIEIRRKRSKTREKQQYIKQEHDVIKEKIPFSKFTIKLQQLLHTYPRFKEIEDNILENSSHFSRNVFAEYGSWLDFITTIVRETKIKEHIYHLIKEQILKHVKHVITVENLQKLCFSKIKAFASSTELLNLVTNFPGTFVSRSENGLSVIGIKRRINDDEKINFLDDSEKLACYTILFYTEDISSSTKMTAIWKHLVSDDTQEVVRTYILGDDIRSPLSAVQYETFLATYQCLFYIHDDKKLSLTVPGINIKKDAIQYWNSNPRQPKPKGAVATSSYMPTQDNIQPTVNMSNAAYNIKSEKRITEETAPYQAKRIKTENSDHGNFQTMLLPVKQEMEDCKPIIEMDQSVVFLIKDLQPLDIESHASQILSCKRTQKFTVFVKTMADNLFEKCEANKIKEQKNLLRTFTLAIMEALDLNCNYEIKYEDEGRTIPSAIKISSKYNVDLQFELFKRFFTVKSLFEQNLTAKQVIELGYEYFEEMDHFTALRKDAFIGNVYKYFITHPQIFQLANKDGLPGLTYIKLNEEPVPTYFHEFMTHIKDLSISLLENTENMEMEVKDLVNKILGDSLFYDRFLTMNPENLYDEAHGLICATMYQQPFHFPINTNMVRLNQRLMADEVFAKNEDNMRKNKKLVAALLELARLVSLYPCKMSELPNIWKEKARPSLINVLGTELSLKISLQKYGVFLFLRSNSMLSVNLGIVEKLKHMINIQDY